MNSLILITLVSIIFVTLAVDEESNLQRRGFPRCLSHTTSESRYCMPLFDYHEQRTNRVPKTLDWSDIVIFMIIHNSPTVDKLIQAHFDTWLKHVGTGVDIVFVADGDDPRSYDEILPDARKVNADIHLFKSKAQDDGRHIRFKVIDAFREVGEIFQISNKKFFFKMDSDTYLVADNFLSYLEKLSNDADGFPIHVGKLMCRHPDVCHSAGALYGFDKEGFDATNFYFIQHYSDITTQEYNVWVPKGNRYRNLFIHEDFMVSYAFNYATKTPSIYHAGFNQYGVQKEGIGTKEAPQISFHQLKDPKLILQHESFFYNEEGKLRPYEELEISYKKMQKDLTMFN